ncbi:MAG TPA: peptide ABC transporter substrate-binding protein [Pyrinomonadaceae bacterium]|nr:peptide ABC transporter substrate-binding protein [Pyrinomonadaceae bacterium]
MKLPGSNRLGLAARWRTPVCVLLSVVLSVGSGCFSGDEGEMFYGRVVVPRAQEFRWSDGGLPRVFDPARAAAAPDTDAVRALFEGLTDYDPQTLQPVAAVAARWESSEDGRVWTFYLRPEARWSNGDPVTAEDFVRSWRRTLRLGEDAPHAKLLANLVGPKEPQKREEQPTPDPPAAGGESTQDANQAEPQRKPDNEARAKGKEVEELTVEAVDGQTLRVRLQRPDRNFPELVAHPVFRPVHATAVAGEGVEGEVATPVARAVESPEQIISNGAFRLRELNADAVVLEREGNYWNADRVALERVRFVGARDAESALAAYRAGEVDAVTNARVEPLGLKLLASYKDFRRATFGALTYYDFNATRPPFDDARVREALARSIDRRRLTEDTLEGAADPAESFLPARTGAETGEGEGSPLAYDPAAARRLLAEAGYPGGAGFPRVRLLVNRNEQHRRVAEAMASMWRSALGVETEVLLKDWAEYETLLRSGEYDVARRSLVMQTTDEETVMRSLFAAERFDFDARTEGAAAPAGSPAASPPTATAQPAEGQTAAAPAAAPPPILTEAQALREVPAVPLYFAASYSLVKPYVQGFDANVIDAPSLQRVRIDTNWQPPKSETRITLRGE